MKVLIIPEYDSFGGTLSFLKRVLSIHKKNNIETGVLIPKKQLPNSMKMFKEYGVTVYPGAGRNVLFSNPLLSPLFDVLFAWQAFRAFRPDLIIVSNGSPGMMTGILLYPIPVLFVMHTYPVSKLRFPIRLFLRMASGMRNRFMTVSRFSADAINSYMGIPRDRVEVVYNSFRPQSERARRIGGGIVLTIGHVVKYKNPESWLKVAQEVVAQRPDTRFVWVGDGDMLQHMRQMISGRHHGDRIEFCGYDGDVEKYYKDAALYFQPSLLESHGISVIDAMAHGLACVTSNVGGLPESVVDGKTGFICSPDDVKGFIMRIISLIDDRNLREKMGNSGMQRAEILFSETAQEKSILKLYRNMAGDLQS